MDISKLVRQAVSDEIEKTDPETKYRTPLVGVARADDPLFEKLREVTHAGHLHPRDLLEDARSAVAFFLPFTGELADANRAGTMATRRWAEAYVETNALISRVTAHITEKLSAMGIRAAYQSPTGNFDTDKLMANWSHRHVAYIAGLGTFGLHNLLITEAGCLGRLGSFVLDKRVEPTPRPTEERCLVRSGRDCGACMDLCPTGALTEEGFDRHRCYDWLLKTDLHLDISSAAVCGKCSLGPCATRIP